MYVLAAGTVPLGCLISHPDNIAMLEYGASLVAEKFLHLATASCALR